MYSLRRWLYKPKREDPSILAQFFYADEELNLVASELDSFDGRKDPERCTALVNQLRQCQDKVLTICNQIMEEVIPNVRANRDFRVKFPDDVLQETLAGQLWFGAECLAAGSSILNRESESSSMRPLAVALTKSLEIVRSQLREQCLRNPHEYSDKIKESLHIFDGLFAEFELSYVSVMVPVKTPQEYDLQQNLIVLFSETLQRALRRGLVKQEMVDDYDPALMFTIPRLAIVCGLLVYPDGPLNMETNPQEISEMFRPFHNLLRKIRNLLWTMSRTELYILEKALSQMEAPEDLHQLDGAAESIVRDNSAVLDDVNSYVQQLYQDYPTCKQLVNEFCSLGLFRSPAEAQAQEPQQLTPIHPTIPEENWQWPSDENESAPNPTERNDADSNNRRNSLIECIHHSRVEHGSNLNVSRSRSSSCYSCRTSSSSTSATMWDSQSSCSSDTSSYTSEGGPDDEEIALALQAAEIASREEARSRFRDSNDLVHKLFVCVSGVADQLQSNYACDLRNILKCVFEMNCSQVASPFPSPSDSGNSTPTYSAVQSDEHINIENVEEASEADEQVLGGQLEPPPWIPDELAPFCMGCFTPFTVVRRRHHCRNCGKVFCGRCSSNSVPLPHYGYFKPVRICHHCSSYFDS